MSRALGRYQLLRPLARGGMAEVFLACRRGAAGVEKRLVIKRIRPERANDPRFLELFVKEARLSMALAHSNIVPVFDFGRAGDGLFLAMEHIDGHDLGACLQRSVAQGRALDPVLAAHIAAECCQALDYAHARTDQDGKPLGVVHSDVTPRNVLISSVGEVKLADFGVALLGGEVAPGARVRGTPAYMAPEQARSQTIDGRADLFALGLVLWEMVSGKRVRTGEIDSLIDQARKGALPPVPDDLPAPLGKIIRRATAIVPSERYAAARDMQHELDAYIISARAARPDWPAPARRLAEWLRELWPVSEDGARGVDDPTEFPAVTFMDDGEEGVLGLDTQRSMAATVGEDDGPEEAAAPAPVPVVSAAPAKRSRRAGWMVLAVVVMAAGGGAIYAFSAPEPEPVSEHVPVLVPVPDAGAGAGAAAGPDAAAPPDAAAAPDAVPASARDAGPRRIKAAPVPPTVETVRVKINSRPWSKFYVDRDPTEHETPETVELTPGKHSIRFDAPEAHVTRTVTLDVPDHDWDHVEVLTGP